MRTAFAPRCSIPDVVTLFTAAFTIAVATAAITAATIAATAAATVSSAHPSATPPSRINDDDDDGTTTVNSTTTTGNSTTTPLTCFGTAPAEDAVGQIIFYLCWAKDYLFAFLRTLPLDFNLALGLFCGAVGLVLFLFCCCCCCCCKKCCCGGNDKGGGKKKRRKPQQRNYEYLDPKAAPAMKSKKNPKTAFDRLPLIGSYIQEKVQPKLYEIPETNMRLSRMGGDVDREENDAKLNYGRIQFSLRRSGNKKSPDITVGVVQAVELEARQQSRTGTPDAYVSVMLVPNKKDSAPKEVFETRVIKDEADPMFQEQFTFKGVGKTDDKTLMLQVWHFDRINVEYPPIGELAIEMSNFDLGRPVEEWHKLKEPDPEKYEKFKKNRFKFGCLCLSFQYVPVISKLTLCILEAKDLPESCKESKDKEESHLVTEPTIDPMVKISLKFDGKKVEKKKTAAKKNTANPYYNEILQFTISPDHVKRVELTVAVVDSHAFGLTDTVGKVIFGPNTAGRARQHWEDMLETQGRPVAQWHVLSNPRMKKK